MTPLAALLDLLAPQVPQAPGSAASTRRALAAVGPLPPRPRLADLGCGQGASALVFAGDTGGEVLALDALPEMVHATQSRAEAAGLKTLRAVVGDMAAPPIPPGSLDLLWSEGAAYAIGFEHALEVWRPLLKPGGAIALTELCWRVSEPPPQAAAFWSAAYPAMQHADACQRAFEAAGFRLLDRFFLPEEDWAAYYTPIATRLPAFRDTHADDPVAIGVADEMAAEIEAWRCDGEAWGYLFLIGRRADRP